MAVLMAACQTPSGDAPSGLATDALGALIERETPAGDAPEVVTPGRPAAEFIGREVAELDAYLGAPALVRTEGRNAFQRYDLERCRAFAVVAPAGGLVQALNTGPLVSGDPAPSFEDCTRGL
ncbi:MAG: hypothetical protein AAGH41_13040 [Pseudomonadota bacterium]